jgi:hypothetical protein
MTFIKLTFHDGKPIHLNMVLCIAIRRTEREDGSPITSLRFDDENSFDVRETPEQIIKMLPRQEDL